VAVGSRFGGLVGAKNAADHQDSGNATSGGWHARPLSALITLDFWFGRQWQNQCTSRDRVRQRKAASTDKPMRRIETIETDPTITLERHDRLVGPGVPLLKAPGGKTMSAGRQRRSRLSQVLAAVALATLFSPMRVAAADLKPETLQAWEAYPQAAKARNHKRLADGASFLSIDAEPADSAKLRQGDVIASPAGPNVPLKVPSGLIHDWAGAIFIPNASIGDVMSIVRDYDHYQAIYHPNVVGSKPIEMGESEDRFSMMIMNKSFFAKSALDSDYRSTFVRVDDQHWYSTTETTRVQELADYAAASQHLLPEGHGTGIIWRLYSFARYEERDGGVYIELEAIALSRDIPATLHWIVDPVVRRVSRSSLVTSLQQTADAVRTSATTISRSSEGPRQDRGAGAALKTGFNPAIIPSFR
jgi:hypothetical protein